MSRHSHRPTGTQSSDHATASSSLLSDIGLIGLSDLEPIILAALATEEPLLLIGPHGTGKSLLLTRIAEALGLAFRHYNSSLLNFDDLVGFPLPNKNGSLEYVKTPASIWGAEAVIFDEISRCRPDIQNKLFPIIHERRAQGILLDGLRYRWAAMNPPMSEDDDEGYLGSEPLDPALTDRFAFVVNMPSWDRYSEEEQLAIILSDDSAVAAGSAAKFRSAVASTDEALLSIKVSIGDAVAVYVRTLVALLARAGISLSPRRAGMLRRSVLAVHAAALTLNADASLVMVGNLDVDVEQQQRIGHLLTPLPPEMRDDTAFMDRLHAYAPGWDYPKLNPEEHLTDHFGLVSDFLSECWSRLRNGNRIAEMQGRVHLGGALSGRDIEAVNKTVSPQDFQI
jgi:MoxR-like ATPase